MTSPVCRPYGVVQQHVQNTMEQEDQLIICPLNVVLATGQC